jgi:ppGpp synthetase/RelA/SpoT-type nucleotidyltranferase
MPKLTAKDKSFLADYSSDYKEYQLAATEANALVADILSDQDIDIIQITSRAKKVSSIKVKLRRKRYSDPVDQLTDKIGVRVITCYGSDVDRIVTVLKKQFIINKRHSVDKRTSLGVQEFGYRSVHLIACLKGPRLYNPEYSNLKKYWFEIQIRSILEHAWAVIDHEIIYKSGISYPKQELRRFASIAGALEILEREFYSLKSIRYDLINKYRDIYSSAKELKRKLDPARLLGLLEHIFPDGQSWRRAEEAGEPFPQNIEVSCLDALKEVGINTAQKLIKNIGRKKIKNTMERYAANAGIAVSHISHMAIIALVVGCSNKAVLYVFLDELSVDPAVVSALR